MLHYSAYVCVCTCRAPGIFYTASTYYGDVKNISEQGGGAV